ncbi:MAG: protein kinase, partial [Planctomycetota bacterium]
AIKILAQELTKDKDFVRRFHQEARASAALNHRNIISGIDVGEANGLHYFVMEYAEGQTAGELLDKRGAFSEKQALTIIRAVASALNQAHQAKLIHRDIKPDNIMLTSVGEVKLLDFGLAKKIDGNSNLTQLTQAGATIGTPYYISPEQASGDPVDIRSDLYSLGVTLFHLVTGEPPFIGKNQLVIMTKHLSEKVPDPRIKHPQISEYCTKLIFRLMEKDKKKRFQTPQELSDALQSVQQTKSILPIAQSSPESLPPTRTGIALSGVNTSPAMKPAEPAKETVPALTKSPSFEKNNPSPNLTPKPNIHAKNSAPIPIMEVFPLTSPQKLPSEPLPILPLSKQTSRKSITIVPAEPPRQKAKPGSRRTRKKDFSSVLVLLILVLLGTTIFFVWKNFFPEFSPEKKLDELAALLKTETKPPDDPKISESFLKQAQIKAFEEFQAKIRSDFSLAELPEQLQQRIHLESFLQRVPDYRTFGEDLLKKIDVRVNELGDLELKRVIQELEQLPPTSTLHKILEISNSFPETLFKSLAYAEIRKIQEKLLQDYQQWKTQQLTSYENSLKNKQYTQAEEQWKILEPNCLTEDIPLFQTIKKSFESEMKTESEQKIYQEIDQFFQEQFLPGLLTRDRAQYEKLADLLQKRLDQKPVEEILPKIQEMKKMISLLDTGLQQIAQYLDQCRQQKKQTILLGNILLNLNQIDLSKFSNEDFLALLTQSYKNEEETTPYLLQKTIILFLHKNYLLSGKTAQSILPQLNSFPFFEEKFFQKLEKIASDLYTELMDKSEGPLSNSQRKEFRRQLHEFMEEYAFTQWVKTARPKITERISSLWSTQELLASLKNNFHGIISLKENQLNIEYDFKSETQFSDFEIVPLKTPSSLSGNFKYHPQGGVYGSGSAVFLWKPIIEGDVEIEITCIPAQITSLGAVLHQKSSWNGYYTLFSFNLWQAMNWDRQDILILSGNSSASEIKLDVLDKQKNSLPTLLNNIHQDSFPEENPRFLYFKFSRKKNQLFLFASTDPLLPESKPLLKGTSGTIQEGKVGFISVSGAVLTRMTIRCSLQQPWFKDN